MNRIVDTCFGEFVIDGNIATFRGDDKFYYHLPSAHMTDDEIKAYFLTLKEVEE